MINKRGKIVPFKRYVPEDATSKKWGELLKDHAYYSSGASAGSFISLDEGEDWYEVVDYSSGNNNSKIYYVIPVDKYGNKYTKSQLRKKFPYDADDYINHMEKYGYATYKEVSRDAEETELLVVRTEAIYPKNKYGNYDYDDVTIRKLSNEYSQEAFDDLDDWGRPTPVDIFLKENPDFDPDLDTVPPRYRKRTVVQRTGNDEVRRNFLDTKAKYDQRKLDIDKRIDDRREAHKGLYSPWSGINEKKLFALMPDVQDKDKEKLLKNIKLFADMPYNHEQPDFENMKDFKRWVNDIGGDWMTVNDVINQKSSALSSAISNANYYNN